MCVPTGKLDGAVVGEAQVLLALLVLAILDVAAGQPKVHQKHLVLVCLAEAEQEVGGLHVCVDVPKAVDVLQHINHPQSDLEDGLEGQGLVVPLQHLLEVLPKAFHNHEPVPNALVLV
uniref:Putative secreted protein n=1 Tax=Ixodes ricinus TaxID=34613 RepID=A0A6B0UMI7_IXORI